MRKATRKTIADLDAPERELALARDRNASFMTDCIGAGADVIWTALSKVDEYDHLPYDKLLPLVFKASVDVGIEIFRRSHIQTSGQGDLEKAAKMAMETFENLQTEASSFGGSEQETGYAEDLEQKKKEAVERTASFYSSSPLPPPARPGDSEEAVKPYPQPRQMPWINGDIFRTVVKPFVDRLGFLIFAEEGPHGQIRLDALKTIDGIVLPFQHVRNILDEALPTHGVAVAPPDSFASLASRIEDVLQSMMAFMPENQSTGHLPGEQGVGQMPPPIWAPAGTPGVAPGLLPDIDWATIREDSESVAMLQKYSENLIIISAEDMQEKVKPELIDKLKCTVTGTQYTGKTVALEAVLTSVGEVVDPEDIKATLDQLGVRYSLKSSSGKKNAAQAVNIEIVDEEEAAAVDEADEASVDEDVNEETTEDRNDRDTE